MNYNINTKTKFTIFFISLTTLVFSQKSYKPKLHTNKWVNGKELTINKNNGIELRTFFNDIKSGKIIFNIKLTNNSDIDVNIDPEKIYYTVNEFETKDIIKNYHEKKKKSRNKISLSESEFLEKYKTDNDTISIEKSNKLIKNLKLLTGLGFLFDSDNLAINRGNQKIDYYKNNLLLKHTIEPKVKLERLLIIDDVKFSKSINIVIPIGNLTFSIPYIKYNPDK